ncbi:MAG: imidazole glycerol phosphate synthase subunit HisH [Alphaproteobacteria bacterium]|nr:imidazole glycerol phosphate synthase subunit HisH [Alphaproteobacteria bacterium]|tara:strand:- start:14074 stop:14718 length:645 start_codon:yes stop_codon:yes gene_type:complete
MSKVTLIHYDIGNLLSVERALHHLGADFTIAKTPEQIENADKLILPGVGAFSSCVNEVKNRGFEAPIKQAVDSGKYLLGICVGMQMLFETSEEFGTHQGLGFIEGHVKAIPAENTSGQPHKIPHIAWTSLQPPAQNPAAWDDPLLSGITPNAEVYFVHSFTAHPDHAQNRVADSYYGGNPIASIVKQDNVYGTQFHPEKSGAIGLKILENFLKL